MCRSSESKKTIYMEFTTFVYICNDTAANYTDLASALNQTRGLITEAVNELVDDEDLTLDDDGVQIVTNGQCIL